MEVPINNIYFNNDAAFSTVYKKINELVKGDIFTAEIIDIKANTVTLKLNDGFELAAKSLVMPEARIGERVAFSVKDNTDGVVKLEFVKDGDDIPESVVNGILERLEIPVGRESRQVIRLLVKNELPLSRENVDKAMFYKYEDTNISEDKLLFLLEEDIPLQKNTLSVLDGLLDKSLSLKENIMTVCEELAADSGEPADEIFNLLEGGILEDFDNTEADELKAVDKGQAWAENDKAEQIVTDELNKISEIINNASVSQSKNQSKNPRQVFERAVEKLFIRLKNGEDVKNIIKGFSKLYELAEKGKAASEDKNPVLAKAFENIKNNIEFTSHINEYKQYIQIPFMWGNNRQEQCELYIFKNPKGQTQKVGSVSALVGLDMAFLGRVEIYVVKNDKALSLQIKSDREESLSLIKKGYLSLEGALREIGYSISSVSFKNIEEPFQITDKNPDRDIKNNKNNENINKKRFSFDMRI